MKSSEPAKLLAASGGDTVKLLDILSNGEKQCVLAYSPSPEFSVNSVKWNHNNMVLASAGDDGEISFWKKNGAKLGELPSRNAGGGNFEPVESISAINFCNKGSRYLCSGGDGKVVRIWDLQSKRCIKWLKGHTDTITGVMCNCKDEHIASVSRKGELIVHNIASGAKAAEMKDPDGQVLEALHYSRSSRHILVTGGDEGSIHVWDTTGRSPKVSWSKQHSAPTTGVCFSPSNDKIIASVGLDMKLYTYHTGSKKQTSCTHHEAPFSSLAYSDDGLTLVAGTATGQVILYDTRRKPQPVTVLRVYGESEAVSNLCWQRSKPVAFNERSCADDTIILAGDAGEAFIMPEPHPSRLSAPTAMPMGVSASRNPSHSSSSRAISPFVSEEKPLVNRLLVNPTLARLHPPKNNIKDDMEVFSPIVEVQPLTPSFDKLWDNLNGLVKDEDKKPAFLFPPRRFGLEEGGSDENPIFEQRSTISASKQIDSPSTFPHSTLPLAPVRNYNPNAAAPHKARPGDRSLERFIHRCQAIKMPTRFAKSTPTGSPLGLMHHGSHDPTDQTSTNATSHSSSASLHGRESSHQETSLASSQANIDTLDHAAFSPRRLSSYAERIGFAPSFLVGSPKSKKTGSETREEILSSLLSNSQPATPIGFTTLNGGERELQRSSLHSDLQQGNSCNVQLLYHKFEETVASLRESIHGDMQNLHIEILSQFHMQEMGMSSVLRLVLENQAEMMKEIQSVHEEIQHLHRLL